MENVGVRNQKKKVDIYSSKIKGKCTMNETHEKTIKNMNT